MPDITVTRTDLAKAVHQQVGLSFNECDQIVLDTLDQISSSLLVDGAVKLSNFGSFKVVYKKERMGRNPKTREDAVVSARRVVVFTAANNLKRQVANRPL
jgi:integration host factor subunit alpha